ncbi:restriction endonuclease subunit S [Bifidobacterium parmae]|uniref:Restriction endonuclease subunit S n=1 Tax=Bifidobacterium parmae TaxID=361854 RepID=A0A2N5J358_9BIFI|nr:restriction endonuclease subunit S [Bifidobacterium parmae]PLS28627.1 restriction endonuclease subunit S [Bifidobacterium parmae]
MSCKNYKLSEVVVLEDALREPLSAKQRSKRKGIYPYYGAQGIVDYLDDYTFQGDRLLVAEDGENLRSNKQPIANWATGKFRVNNHAHVLCESALCNLKYLHYLLNELDLSAYITGSTQPKLSQKSLLSIEIHLPDRELQDKVVAFMRPIESEITCLTQANGHLLEIGQSIFDEKLKLCDFTEGTPGSLGDIAEGNPRRQLSKGTIAKYIDMSSLSTTGPYPNGWIQKAYNGGMRFTNGDTLLARITPCLENSKASYVNYLDENEVAFGSTEYIVLTGKDEIPNEIFYFLVRNSNFIEYMVGHMNGSSGRQRVSVKDALSYPIHIPDDKIIKTIGHRLSMLLNAVNMNSKQIRKLSQLRDTLLPKLMSGEIDLSKVELPMPSARTAPTNGRLAD